MQTIWSGRLQSAICLLGLILLIFLAVPACAFAENNADPPIIDTKEGKTTYIVEVNENFTKTMVTYIKRSLKNAENDGADYFLINMNTYANYDRFAKELSDRVIFMEKGLVCQEGTPEEVFGNPNARVKEFIGRVMQV